MARRNTRRKRLKKKDNIKRVAERKQQRARKERVRKLEAKVRRELKKLSEGISYADRYRATSSLPQYQNWKDREENALVFLKDLKSRNTSEHMKWIATMTAKTWTEDKAEKLYDLVTTDVYSMFRQKYKPPSDYYDILLEDFSPQEIESAMNTLLQDSNVNIEGDYKKSEIINALYDLLADTL